MHQYTPRLSAKQKRTYRAEVAQALTNAGAPPGRRLKAGRCDPHLLAAIERTSRLLSYSSHASSAARWFTNRVREVRERKHGKSPGSPYAGRYPRHSPRTMLARVLEHYAMVAEQPHRFPTANAEHEALARAFLMTSKGAHTQHSRWWRAAGKYISQELASFCIPFIRENLAASLADEKST